MKCVASKSEGRRSVNLDTGGGAQNSPRGKLLEVEHVKAHVRHENSWTKNGSQEASHGVVFGPQEGLVGEPEPASDIGGATQPIGVV